MTTPSDIWKDRVRLREDGKIIWQIWHDWNAEKLQRSRTKNAIKRKGVPEHWKSSPESVKKFHPDWDYYLLDEEDNRNFVAHYFPDFLSYYDNFPYPVQRVDAIRYMRQYIHGGLYMDLDMEVIKPLDDLLLEKEDLVFLQSGNFSNYITNPFFYCRRPGHPFWLKVIEEMKKLAPWWAFTKHFTVMTTTGPIMLSRVYRKWCYPTSISGEQSTNGYALKDHRRHGKPIDKTSTKTKKSGDFQEISGYPTDKSQSYPTTLIPSKYIIPCSMCEPNCIVPIESYVRQLPGGSWMSWDSKLFNFCYCHKDLLIFFGIVILVIILIWLYSRFKQR